jgi:hypothetical protein
MRELALNVTPSPVIKLTCSASTSIADQQALLTPWQTAYLQSKPSEMAGNIVDFYVNYGFQPVDHGAEGDSEQHGARGKCWKRVLFQHYNSR